MLPSTEELLTNRFYDNSQEKINFGIGYQMISIPRFTNPLLIKIYDSYMSSNHEYLLMSSDQSTILIQDMTTQRKETFRILKSTFQYPLTSCTFSHYTQHVICGSVMGGLVVGNFYQLPSRCLVKNFRVIRDYICGQILAIYHFKNDILIVISNRGFKVCYLEELLKYYDSKLTTTKSYREQHYQVEPQTPGKFHEQEYGITASVSQNQTIVYSDATGIIHMHKFDNGLTLLKAQTITIKLQDQQIITCLQLNENTRILFVALANIDYTKTEDQQIHLIDLKKKKTFMKQEFKSEEPDSIQRAQFFPLQNMIIAGSGGGSIYVFEMENSRQQTNRPSIHSQSVRGLFMTYNDQYWPKVISVGMEGKVLVHMFDAPKLHSLNMIPFVFWVEQRLNNTINYIPQTTDQWGHVMQAIAGFDRRNNSLQRNCFLAERFFQPFFLHIREHSEFKNIFWPQYKRYQQDKQKLFYLPQSIVYGAIRAIPDDYNPEQADSIFAPDNLSHTFKKTCVKKKVILSKKKVLLEKSSVKPRMSELQNLITKKDQSSTQGEDRYIEKSQNNQAMMELKEVLFEEQQSIQVDDRLVLFEKLLKNIILSNPAQNLIMINFSHCPILFDQSMGMFEKILDELPKMVTKVTYADFSHNNIDLHTAIRIANIFEYNGKNLKYLDFSFNRLGSRNKQNELKAQEKSESKFQSNINNLFSASVVSIRDNGFEDNEGHDIIQQAALSKYLTVLDISGNLDFGLKTIQAIKEMSLLMANIVLKNQQADLQVDIDVHPMVPSKAVSPLKNQGTDQFDNHETQHKLTLVKIPIQNKPTTIIKAPIKIKEFISNLQLLVVEFSPALCEQAMKSITAILINQQKSLQPHDFKSEAELVSSVPKKFINCYVYVVNNKLNSLWDQSLLAYYDNADKQSIDHIKGCIYTLLGSILTLFTMIWGVIEKDLWPCIKQCFMSIFFVKKYIICCYCICLQSEYGLWITKLMGITTADYEYNEKKDQLKQSLEQYKVQMNFLFWFNFIAFFSIVIVVPFKFVLICEGHQWTGHLIYLAYAFFVMVVEVILSLYCIKYNITNQDYVHGTRLRRTFFFVKDIIISQIGKFDVYSDICFITIALTCGDTHAIGYLAAAVMVVNMSMVAYQVLKLLTSRFGGDENYIDYLCNYCSFVEIHLVAILLEKWTIQNTTDFLWFKGLPNRVYAAVFKTFCEDIPQFCLQLAYLYVNPQRHDVAILILSLSSSVFSTIISITKSLTITKANRINDQIMMSEVKTKLQIEKQVVDKDFNLQLQIFLHDYYDTYDGNDQILQMDYGLHDNLLKNRDKSKFDDPQRQQAFDQLKINQGNKGEIQSLFRLQAGPGRKSMLVKGLTQLEENQTDGQIISTGKRIFPNQEQDIGDDIFEVYDYFINNDQAGIIKKLWLDKTISKQEIAEAMLQLELRDFQMGGIATINPNQDTTYDIIGGSFIDSIYHQQFILNVFYNSIKTCKEPVSILDCGCGSGFTTVLIIRLCEVSRPAGSFSIICIDHMQVSLDNAKSAISIYYQNLVDDGTIKFILQDARASLFDNYGRFDLINIGFAVQKKLVSQFTDLLRPQGKMCLPLEVLPSYHMLEVHGLDDQGELQNYYQQPMQQLAGPLTSKQLQYPEVYQYLSIQRGTECQLCKLPLFDQSGQYYCPFTEDQLCLQCGDQDDENVQIQNFVYPYNLVYIPKEATETQMREIDSYKFGKNVQPKPSEREGNKKHSINCSPCEREQGDEENHEDGPRYICLNCRPGPLEDQMHVDICSSCAKSIICREVFKMEHIMSYLEQEGHQANHVMLKVHFNHGYFRY